MQFDENAKNEFTIAMLDKRVSNANEFEKFLNPDNRNPYKYDGPKGDKECAAVISSLKEKGDINDAILLRVKYEYHKDTNAPFATKLREYWGLMRYIFANYDVAHIATYKLILGKIGMFNEEAQLAILKRLYDMMKDHADKKVLDVIFTKIANNEFATLEDKYTATRGLLHFNHDVVRDFVESAKKELSAVLNAEFTSPEKLKLICKYIDDVLCDLQASFNRNVPNNSKIVNPLNEDYINVVRSIFDEDKALLGGNEYVAKQNKYWEDEATKATTRAKEAEEFIEKYEQANSNLRVLNKEMMEYKDLLEIETSKNKSLIMQLNELNEKVKKQNSVIDVVKMKLASMQNKLLTKGFAKDLQQLISKEENR